MFFNVDHFGERLREAIRAAKSRVEWVILDASPINWIDATTLQHLDEPRSELAAGGIVLGIARVRLLGFQVDMHPAPGFASLSKGNLLEYPPAPWLV